MIQGLLTVLDRYEQKHTVPECVPFPVLSFQNMPPPAPLDLSDLDSALQQQQRIMSVSHALASEASRKSKLVAGE